MRRLTHLIQMTFSVLVIGGLMPILVVAGDREHQGQLITVSASTLVPECPISTEE